MKPTFLSRRMFFRRVRNESLTSLGGGARMLKSCQLLRLEKKLCKIAAESHVKTGQKRFLQTFGQKINDVCLLTNIF